MKYAIVIPAKNEESDIGNTLQCIVNQTLQPVKCLIIDDGSTDNTAQVVKKYCSEYPIFHYVTTEGKTEYVLGGHVVKVFNKGKDVIDSLNIDYDYIVKLDADIVFNPAFFEEIDKKLKNNKYGIVSGTPYYLERNKKIYEFSPEWHSHGQFKFYHRDCLKEMNGLVANLGWDAADNIIAIEKGWKTKAFRDIFYQMSRKVGGKSSLLKGRIKHGIGAYNLRYNIFYILMKLMHDLFKPPYLIGPVYYLYGYIKSVLAGHPRTLNEKQGRLLRKLLWNSFFERFKNKNFILFQKLKKK